ncbi:alpha/beta hydrolase domain-containing protein [Sphingobium chlorophenolicum L-1]|uniref:Alpha/beta hydrolase domain-containing protein n=1 Tax=Sphingobium chlorophenolicum L-1 TaxID=690566 RepID=F6F1L5_SPHCR|nr:alpha/beta hydrolase [Sphingobium chlorophenolicum]AEG51431.1 alpha/beta hydrolase domain-containing protein [Sphingobium chlorophenolicum L-1]
MTGPAIDPEMDAIAAAMAAGTGPSILSGDVGLIRAVLTQLSPKGGPEMQGVEDREIGGVSVRDYTPFDAVAGAIVLFHGGGWTVGSVDDYDHFARSLAESTRYRVFSVDYRLAPENPFPAAVEDAWNMVRSIEVDGPLFLLGDSAGGNLSAVVAQLARDHGGPAIDGQILIYPSVAGDADSASMNAFVPPVMKREEIAAYYDLYVPSPGDRADIRFAPLSGRLDGLPPALVVTGGQDLFADEATRYADALERAGVPVARHEEPRAFHAYLTLFPNTQAAARSREAIRAFIAANGQRKGESA